MNDSVNPNIEEAEVIESSPTTNTTTANVNPTAPAFDIQAYNATLEIVRRRIVILEKIKKEHTTFKEMLNDIFRNDSNYIAADKVVQEVTKKRKEVQAQLSRQPQAVELNGKIKDLKEQIKDNENALSQELMEYYKTAGVTEIEDEEGNVQEFTITVKLKPKKRAE